MPDDLTTADATKSDRPKAEHAVLKDFTFTQKDGTTLTFKKGDVFQASAGEDVSVLVADGKLGAPADKADAKAAKEPEVALSAGDVHQLQAERQTFQMNLDVLEPPKDTEADKARAGAIAYLKAKIKEIDKRLGI